MQGSFKRVRAGLDGHRSAPADDTGQPPPHRHQVLDFIGSIQSGSEVDLFHLVIPFTAGDEQSSTGVMQMEKMDEIFEGETSNVTDSPVDEKSAGSDSKAFIQQCIVRETNVLVDEQSAGAGTNIGNPVDEQSAGITNVLWNLVDEQCAGTTYGSGNPVDGQSAGLTKEQGSSNTETLVIENVEGLDEDTVKKMLTNTTDAILDHDDIDLGCNTLLEHKLDIGCAMPIRQFMRGISLGTPVEEVDVTIFHSKQGRKFHMAEEHVHFMKGGRRYSWDIPPDESNKAVTFNDGVVQSSSVGGRKFSWDKPPNLSNFNSGLVNLQCMGGKHYRWDSYRAPSHEEFISHSI